MITVDPQLLCLTCNITCEGDVGQRLIVLEHICDEHRGHCHKQDHLMVVYRGAAEVWECDKDHPRTPLTMRRILRPGDEPYLVKADTYHTYKALEDSTQVGCRFQIRDRDGNPVSLEQIYPENVTIIDDTWFY